MPQDELIGSAEAARILGKSPRTVHRLVKAGTLTPAHVAPGGFVGSFLFNRSDVEELLEAAKSA
jgi:excisionase family DNA binding protein